jgi:hypothetical protein
MDAIEHLTPDEQIEIYRAIKKLLKRKEIVSILSLSLETELSMDYLFENIDDVVILLESAAKELKIR